MISPGNLLHNCFIVIVNVEEDGKDVDDSVSKGKDDQHHVVDYKFQRGRLALELLL